MACEWEVLLRQDAPSLAAEQAVEALELVARLEECWSVYKPHSELSKLNAAESAKDIDVSQNIIDLLEAALAAYQRTGGGFDITAGSLTDTWGFSRQKARKPDDNELRKALACVGSCYLKVDAAKRRVAFQRRGIHLNPGGIGKGLALERAARWLIDSQVENFIIHGGRSSIRAVGERKKGSGTGWPVALKNPANPDQVLGIIHLFDQALGTSGHAHQYFHYQGTRYGHVIDPRTGWPVQGVESVTVLCPDAAIADALATGLYVLGPSQWARFAELNQDIAIIGLIPGKRSGEVHLETWNLPSRCWETV